ncbi:MAG: cation:proton antiporter [Phycisphaeraceae bacterium]|nr:cation:proton antiporter [Phycisphaeraceae bacterium]
MTTALPIGLAVTPPTLTLDLLAILAAAALLSIVGQRLRLALVPAYLLTGLLIGPNALGLIRSPASFETIGQLAIILLLFGIGLEMHLALIRNNLARMLTVGLISSLLGVLLGWPLAVWCFDLPAPTALVVALALANSSTAMVLRMLAESRQLSQLRGRLAFSILFIQDLLFIGMLLVMPALAYWGSRPAPSLFLADDLSLRGVLLNVFLGLAILASLIALAKIFLPKLFRESARSRSGESILILALAVAIGAAVAAESLGFSSALGGFLAGFILNSTPFRHQLRAQVAPLRDLFIAVFFTTLGMRVDPQVALASWGVILLACLLLTAVKTTAIAATCWALGSTAATAVAVGCALAQAGEFSLVLLDTPQARQMLSEKAFSVAIAVVVLSLLLTPALIKLGRFLAGRVYTAPLAPWFKSARLAEPPAPAADADARPPATPNHSSKRVIVGGYGPVGRAVAEKLQRAGMEIAIIELNPSTVERQAQLGQLIVYGDVSDPTVLEAAGITSAAALIVTVPDDDAALRAVSEARRLCPALFIAVRTNILSRGLLATEAGADHVTIEELATAEAMQQAILDKLVPTASDHR